MFRRSLLDAQKVLADFISDDHVTLLLERSGELMTNALREGKRVFSCGNGGSMCDAMHFAEELTGRFREDRRALPAIAIADPAHITCVANDYGFKYIFSRYLEAHGVQGDILLAISTSGNSPNIIEAIHVAKEREMKVIGLTGKNGGEMAALCDVAIVVPWKGYSDRIQEIHIKIIHMLIDYIEQNI